jgi:tRNA(fMet)-specific endonuclease VapC
MPTYLLDTNQLGQAVTVGTAVRQRVMEMRALGRVIGICVPVLCELEVGIQQVRDADQYRSDLKRLLRRVRIWPIEVVTSRFYGEIYVDLRRRGRALSQVDMMLAALARQMRLTLVTSDRDFEALPDIPTENWAT